MLNEQTIQAAYPLAAKLDEKGIALRPAPGSFLAVLVSDCGDLTELHYKGEDGCIPVDSARICEFVNAPSPVTGYCPLTLDLDEMVDKISGAVVDHINVAKTKVIPTIEDLVGRVAPQLEAASRTPMSDFDVQIYSLPAPMLEPALIDSAERARNIAPDSYVLGLRLPALMTPEIVQLMLSGSTSLDASIENFVATLAPGALESYWRELFTPDGSSVELASLFDRSVEGLNRAIVAFLVTRRIWDKPIENTDMTLARYEEEMTRLRDQAALRLLREMDTLATAEKNGIMIRGISKKSVQVNARVYKDWINQGGSNEILFGNMMLGSPAMTIEDLMSRKNEAEQAWRSFCSVNKTTEANKRFSACKSIMRLEFGALVRDCGDDMVATQDRELVNQRFEEALEATTEVEVTDVYSWAQRLLCSSVFYRTDAGVILSAINRIKMQSPELDVNEAANIASLEYIARWVASYFQVVPAVR